MTLADLFRIIRNGADELGKPKPQATINERRSLLIHTSALPEGYSDGPRDPGDHEDDPFVYNDWRNERWA